MSIQLKVFVEDIDNGVQYYSCNISTTKYSYILVRHKVKDSYFTNHTFSDTVFGFKLDLRFPCHQNICLASCSAVFLWTITQKCLFANL